MRASLEKSSFLQIFLIGFLLGLISSIIVLAQLLKKINKALHHTSNVSKKVFHRLIPFSNDSSASSNKSETISNQNNSTDRPKTWMFYLVDSTYDPLMISFSMTRLCRIELRQNFLFIFRTEFNLDRKSTDDELDKKANFNQIDIYNLDETTIGLLPTNINRSKYWSKKSPLVLQNILYLGHESISTENNSVDLDLLTKKIYSNQERKILQLFTRTRRSKEEWFYRFINASQINSWRHELNHRLPADFYSDETSQMFSTRETTEIRKSFKKKTTGNYRQQILQLLGTNDRFSAPHLFSILRPADVREEHPVRFINATTIEESSRQVSRNNNINLKYFRETESQHQSPDHQWLVELGNDRSSQNDLLLEQDTQTTQSSFKPYDNADNRTHASSNEIDPQESLQYSGEYSPLLHFVLNYLQECPDHSKLNQHSNPLLLINIFAARCFLDLFDNEIYLQRIRTFFQKQLEKIQIPFVEHLQMADLDLGDRLPKVQEVFKPWCDEHGLWFSMKTIFEGKFHFTITAKLRWNRKTTIITQGNHVDTPSSNQLGTKKSLLVQNEETLVRKSSEKKITWKKRLWPPSRWFQRRQSRTRSKIIRPQRNQANNSKSKNEHHQIKIRKLALALQFEVNRIDGILLFNIPPIPSDRLWISFLDMPDIQFSATPRLGHYRVSFSKITRRLERKLRHIFHRYFVMPNMKDLIVPTINDYLFDDGFVRHRFPDSKTDNQEEKVPKNDSEEDDDDDDDDDE